MPCIVWILDSGVESFLSVSLGSLRLRAPKFWQEHPKVVVNCGISPEMKEYLAELAGERVYVLPGNFCTSKNDTFGVPAMRQRIEISEFAHEWRTFVSPFDGNVLVVDTDTVFLRSPKEFPFPDSGADIVIMPDWNIVDGKIAPTPVFRPCSIQRPQSKKDVEHIAQHLRLSVTEFLSMRSHNTGVFGLHTDRPFSAAWRAAYDELTAATDLRGAHVFAPFAAEQNAMSLAIHRGWIHPRALPRRFNRLPPRPPRRWLAPTVIAHFVTFSRFHHEQRYKLWFQTVAELRDAGLLPTDFAPPHAESANPTVGGTKT